MLEDSFNVFYSTASWFIHLLVKNYNSVFYVLIRKCRINRNEHQASSTFYFHSYLIQSEESYNLLLIMLLHYVCFFQHALEHRVALF